MRTVEELAERIAEFVKRGPVHFYDILVEFRGENYRDILLAWGELRSQKRLGREKSTGKFIISDVKDR